VAVPSGQELAYATRPLQPLGSLCVATADLALRLADVTCPALVFTRPQDHVVPPVSSDVLAAGVSGPVERVSLDRSYHVATLDFDKDEIERGAVEFARKVTSG